MSLMECFVYFSRLLYSVLPISVANELRHERPVPARRYESVTLLFSGIVGFSQYCAANSDARGAMKIIRMLNQLYTAFDVLTDPKKNPNVYKVIYTYITHGSSSNSKKNIEWMRKCIAFYFPMTTLCCVCWEVFFFFLLFVIWSE